MAGSSVDGLIQDIGNITAKRSFGSGDKVFFFKEMSYLLKGGVAIIDAVKTLNQSTDNLVLQQITHYIFQALDEGKSLTYALGRLPQYFTAGDVAIIKSGESSGKLP
jgi:type II secretory pathway component PulF